MRKPRKYCYHQTKNKKRDIKVKRFVAPAEYKQRKENNECQNEHGLGSQEQEQAKASTRSKCVNTFLFFKPAKYKVTGNQDQEQGRQIHKDHLGIGHTRFRGNKQTGQFTEDKEQRNCDTCSSTMQFSSQVIQHNRY